MGRLRSHAFLCCVVVPMLLAGCGGFKGVLTPTLSSITPSTVAAGSPGFTLTATGTNFVGGTKILWDGTALPTTLTSPTQLTASISAAQIATAGTISVRVIKPDSTTSDALQLTITGTGGGGFSLTSISPSSVAAGSPSFSLTAIGVGFVNGSTITLNGTAVTTTFDSPTQIHGTVPASSVASAGTITVGVTNPDKTKTNTLTLTVTGASTGPVPTLTSLSPNASFNGIAAPLPLTANGTNFVSGSQIMWNGVAMITTFVSSTQLTASIPAKYFTDSAIGTSFVSVLNPDSTVSNELPFTITVSPTTTPVLTSISPTKSQVGDPGFTLTLNGTFFAPGAVASFGGTALATTVVSDIKLTAQVPASLLTAVAEVQVTVKNAQSIASNPLPYLVGMNIFFGEVNDIVWDGPRNILYMSQPSTSTKQPNTVQAIDPITLVAEWTYSPGTGSEPDRLALSADGKYLYVGLDGKGTVQRLILGNQTNVPDISIPLGSDPNLGSYYAMDLQVSPKDSNTIAVARGIPASKSIELAHGGVAIYDGTAQRPQVVSPATQAGKVLLDTIQWSADGTRIYAANNENFSGDFYELAVSNTGVALSSDQGGIFTIPNQRIHFDVTNGLIYADEGSVVDPATSKQVANFQSSGVMVPDSTIGNAYFLGQPVTDNGRTAYQVDSFNLTSHNPIAQLSLYQVEGAPNHLVRWGTNGLAFNTRKITNCVVSPCTTQTGRLYILDGPFVTQTVPQ